MSKKIILSLLTLLTFLVSVQLAAPVSATTLIDSGSGGVYNPDNGVRMGTWYYKTWNEGYKLHTIINAYETGFGKFLTMNIYLKKTDSKTLKIYYSDSLFGAGKSSGTVYMPTDKSATLWYQKTPFMGNIKIRSNYDKWYWYTTGGIGISHNV